MKYRVDIDGLRAVAVMLVLIFHFDLFTGGKAGFIGVDVFFVISGFLITSIIMKQMNEGSFSLRSFYAKRIRRLAPSLCAVLFLTLIAGGLLLFPTDFKELSRQVLFSQTYIANFYFWRNINYFGLKADNVYLLHTWSLAVEEQFYLFYPLFMIAVHRYLKRYLGVILFAGLILSFSLNILFVDSKPEATFYLFPTRAWELLIGGLIPLLHLQISRSGKVNEILGIVGLGLILSSVFLFSNEVKFPGYFALLPTVGAACLIFSGANDKTLTSRILSFAPIVYIGRISYSLYLVHWPINVFAKLILEENYTLLWRLAMFALSIFLSAVLYHLIENPVRYKRVLGTDKRLVYGYLTSLAATGAIFAVVISTGGLPERFPSEVVRLANFVNDKTPPLNECQFRNKPILGEQDFCQIGVPGMKPNWLVYGDSHAWAAHSVFDKWLRKNNQSGLFIFQHSCPPVIGVHLFRDHGNCFNFNKEIANFLKIHPKIENVFLVSLWRQAIGARLSTSYDIKFSKENSIRLFNEKFSSTVKYFHDLGKKVFVWEPVPGAKQKVPYAMARHALTNHSSDIRFSTKEYFSDFDYFFEGLKKNASSIEKSFSPSKALCGSGLCDVVVDGKPVYFDGNHLTSSTADFWVDQIDNQFLN